jgi:adenylate kinase
MKIMFLGAPGAGKGTLAGIASKELDIPTISTGAIIREAIKNKTPLGLKAEEAMRGGALVSDDVVIGIIQERLAKDDCKRGFILDGFPRTVPQAEALEKMGILMDRIISIEAPDELIIGRLAGRRVCPACGATYHTVNQPSKDNKTCDICGVPLALRRDDEPETIRNRLAVYHEQTEPLKDFYKKHKGFIEIDGTKDIAASTLELGDLLRKNV